MDKRIIDRERKYTAIVNEKKRLAGLHRQKLLREEYKKRGKNIERNNKD